MPQENGHNFRGKGGLKDAKSRKSSFCQARSSRRVQHHESLEGSRQWRCPRCYRESCERHQACSNDCLLENTVQERLTLQNQSRRSWDWEYGKKGEVGGRFQDMAPGEIQELKDTTPEGLIEGHWMDASAPSARRWGRRRRRTVPENKLTLGDLEAGFWLFMTAFDCFYDIDLLWYRHEAKANGRRRPGTK